MACVEEVPYRSKSTIDTNILALMGVSLLFWASAFAGIGAGLRAYSPGHLVLLRFLSASAALAACAVPAGIRPPRLADLPAILLMGILGFTLYHIALVYGQVTVDAGTASLLSAASPALTAVAAGFFLREQLSPIGWAGIAVSFAGTALIAVGKGQGFRLDPGALLILLAALSSSLFNVLQKPYLERYRALDLTAYAIWAGTLPMLVYTPGLGHAVATAPLSATLAVVYLGVFPAALSYVLWSYALSRAPASIVSSFLNVSTPLAILIAWAWLGVVPAPLSILGGLIALAGVVVVNTRGRWTPPRRAQKVAPAAHSMLRPTSDRSAGQAAG